MTEDDFDTLPAAPLSHPLLDRALELAKGADALPSGTDFAFLAAKEGDAGRVGVIVKVGDHWRVAYDLGLHKHLKPSHTFVVMGDVKWF
jgi:hypothetical protein